MEVLSNMTRVLKEPFAAVTDGGLLSCNSPGNDIYDKEPQNNPILPEFNTEIVTIQGEGSFPLHKVPLFMGLADGQSCLGRDFLLDMPLGTVYA